MNLRKLTDDNLHRNTIWSADACRESVVHLLHHLAEVERRRLYSKYSTNSLFKYCTRYLKMSEQEATTRVNASRLLTECGEIEEKVNSGELSLTSMSLAQRFFKDEAKAGRDFSAGEKSELLERISNQPTREAERILLSNSVREVIVPRETVRVVSPTMTGVTTTFDQETLADLNFIKAVWSYRMPGATYGDVIKEMARIVRQQVDPVEKAKRALQRKQKKAEAKESERRGDAPLSPLSRYDIFDRYIPAAVRHAVWLRDAGACTFRDPISGERCDSRHRLDLDHIISFALGGTHDVANLRLRCFAHNQRHAIETYGVGVLKYAYKKREHLRVPE